MKISFSSFHKYPGRLHGVASHSVHDNIVRGLGELGHEVWYQLKEKPEVSLPDGVEYATHRRMDADIYHINDGGLEDVHDKNLPWIKILHCDVRLNGFDLSICQENWVYVSETLANLYGSKRFVLNGIDPEEFIFSETKDDYLFFIVGGLSRAKMKGIDMAIAVAEKSGHELRIAGSSNVPSEIEKFKSFCDNRGITFCGPVYGEKKAELFAGAKALLFPSNYNEACPLVISEALMSGTPVISSTNGACPELINKDVGFTCNTELEYLNAVDSINKIKSVDCRNYAFENFHYLKMAKNYVHQYEYELEKCIDSSTIY